VRLLIQSYPLPFLNNNNPDPTSIFSSIRLIFSISDIQPEEDFDEEEPESDSESDVDENPAPYPVRAALTITKVRIS
jgi:hypothetical protein